MLGTALQRILAEQGRRFEAPPEREFDITGAGTVATRVSAFADSLAPDERGVLVNAAAYTNVERAESEPDIAQLVNETGAALLATAAADYGLAFAHVSTDFVFDGTKHGAYVESDPVNPLSVYGRTKLAGERAVASVYPEALIVRTAWVFGGNGANFPVKILEAARSRPELSVVTDEIGSPTYTIDLARGIVALLDGGAAGVFHLAGAGSCSRFELAAETLRLAGLATPIAPVTSDAFPTTAARPANSVLDCSKAAALGVTMRDWRDSLGEFVAEIDAAVPR